MDVRTELQKQKNNKRPYDISIALGYESMYDMGKALHSHRHLISSQDVDVVVAWLLEQGFEIIKKQ